MNFRTFYCSPSVAWFFSYVTNCNVLLRIISLAATVFMQTLFQQFYSPQMIRNAACLLKQCTTCTGKHSFTRWKLAMQIQYIIHKYYSHKGEVTQVNSYRPFSVIHLNLLWTCNGFFSRSAHTTKHFHTLFTMTLVFSLFWLWLVYYVNHFRRIFIQFGSRESRTSVFEIKQKVPRQKL